MAFINDKPIEMRGPEGGQWCHTYEPHWIPDWEYREAQSVHTIDVEKMLSICLPGGHSCDPQHIADAVRAYCRRETV